MLILQRSGFFAALGYARSPCHSLCSIVSGEHSSITQIALCVSRNSFIFLLDVKIQSVLVNMHCFSFTGQSPEKTKQMKSIKVELDKSGFKDNWKSILERKSKIATFVTLYSNLRLMLIASISGKVDT